MLVCLFSTPLGWKPRRISHNRRRQSEKPGASFRNQALIQALILRGMITNLGPNRAQDES